MTDYLLGVGAAKCGTTLLYDLLLKHPDLAKASYKELHYFDCHENVNTAEYNAFFAGAPGVKLDITPAYMFWQGCMERAKATLADKDVKIVVLLRDPIERALSHYLMTRRHGLENLSFAESFFREKERMAVSAMGYRQHSYFTRGLYADQLDRLFTLFPKDHIKVFLFEDFVAKQQETVNEVTDFCGIRRIKITQTASNTGYDIKSPFIAHALRSLSRRLPGALMPLFRPVQKLLVHLNRRAPDSARILPDALRCQLVEYYAQDVKRLSEVYGVDTTRFKNFRPDA